MRHDRHPPQIEASLSAVHTAHARQEAIGECALRVPKPVSAGLVQICEVEHTHGGKGDGLDVVQNFVYDASEICHKVILGQGVEIYLLQFICLPSHFGDESLALLRRMGEDSEEEARHSENHPWQAEVKVGNILLRDLQLAQVPHLALLAAEYLGYVHAPQTWEVPERPGHGVEVEICSSRNLANQRMIAEVKPDRAKDRAKHGRNKPVRHGPTHGRDYIGQHLAGVGVCPNLLILPGLGRWQGGDGPRLEKENLGPLHRPLHVLGRAEGGLGFLGQCTQSPGDGLVNAGSVRAIGINGFLADAAGIVQDALDRLLRYGSREHAEVPFGEHEAVGRHLARDQGLAHPEAGLDDQPVGPAGDRIGGEEHARRFSRDESLDDHGHVRAEVIESIPLAVVIGPLRPQRGPAFLDGLNTAREVGHAQIGVVLPGKRMSGQILHRGRGSHRHAVGPEHPIVALYLFAENVRQGRFGYGLANIWQERLSSHRRGCAKLFHSRFDADDEVVLLQMLPEGSAQDAESRWNRQADPAHADETHRLGPDRGPGDIMSSIQGNDSNLTHELSSQRMSFSPHIISHNLTLVCEGSMKTPVVLLRTIS